VAQPVSQLVAETLEFTGNTRARATVEIRSRVTGYLQKVAFEDGAHVQAGDLLFVIDPAPFEADVQLAEAALQKAQAIEQLAKVNLTRALELQKQRAIAKQEVDADDAELSTATASVRSAEASLRKSKLDLGYAEIRAPIGGRIGRHLLDAGNLVNAEETLLAVIENIDPIYAYFYVSESIELRFMQLVREHKLPDPAVQPPLLQLGLQNEEGFPHQGSLDYRELGVDPQTGTISRRAVFPNPDRALIPGLFVRLQTKLGEPIPKLLVEERAIGTDQRGAYLLVVDDKNVVEYRSVKLGAQAENLRVIEQGVSEADWVVVNGLQRARPGTTVRPQRTEKPDKSSSSAARED
jgi:multidrug efflux system membrane fusion protein